MIVLSLRVPDLELAYRIKKEETRASEIENAGLDEQPDVLTAEDLSAVLLERGPGCIPGD
jgi:hypothetical protein